MPLKQSTRILPTLLVILTTLLASGCGALDGNVQVTYRPDGTARAAVHLEGTEALGFELGHSDLSTRLQEQGWQVETAQSGNLTALSAWVERPTPAMIVPPLRALARPDLVNQPGMFDHWRFHRDDGLFASEFNFVAQLPEDGLGGAAGLPTIMFMPDEQRRASADKAARFRVTVEMPGELVETNADFQSGGIAAWQFTYNELDRGRVLMATSRATHWGNIAAAGLFTTAIGLVVTGVLVRMLGGTSAPTPPAPALPAALLTPPHDADMDAAEPAGDIDEDASSSDDAISRRPPSDAEAAPRRD